MKPGTKIQLDLWRYRADNWRLAGVMAASKWLKAGDVKRAMAALKLSQACDKKLEEFGK